MIDTKELRIGNLLLKKVDPKEYLKNPIVVTVDARTIYDITYWPREVGPRYDPVPITENWLKRLGFVQNSNYFTIETGTYRTVNGEDMRTKLKLRHLVKDNSCFVVSPANGSIWVRNVHTLQNLFFALTGEELTIKEPKK